eukprot:TRINITY_DN195_c0_g1_i1.p1 TRINITY_DN195_c0_g1~~TRINITY_DN195_c0_g1_i1.p1  ORF type:complete len:420 (-),score=93.18 TRINITY_DN195_c0_g1_i1:205-1464(-)
MFKHQMNVGDSISSNTSLDSGDGMDDFSVDTSLDSTGYASRAHRVSNQHFDEAVEVGDDDNDNDYMRDSLDSNNSDMDKKRGDTPPVLNEDTNDTDDEHEDMLMRQALAEKTVHQMYTGRAGIIDTDGKRSRNTSGTIQKSSAVGNLSGASSVHDVDDESSDDDDDLNMIGSTHNDDNRKHAVGYNKEDYSKLAVSAELRELFEYITRFTPQTIELETALKPFIPEYIPSVGEIDPFLKVHRPDGEVDGLGLNVLDEPSNNQSDPAVLIMKLRQFSKTTASHSMMVHGIENADKNPKAVESWIEKIQELHHSKPPASVSSTHPFPETDELMQEWPAALEELLDQIKLPPDDIDMPLRDYIRTICAILDIPVYSNIIESLHVLFTLYSGFQENQHFQFGTNRTFETSERTGSRSQSRQDY